MSEIANDCDVSVVVPIFNRQKLGERAILSACGQAIDGMEVIAVDDGSEPPFRMPVTPASARIRLLRHESNLGASVARNSGITAARGTWIALLDSDDYWLPDTLKPRLDFAKQAVTDAGPHAFAAGFVIRRGSGPADVRIPCEAATPLEFVCGCWFAPGSTILFRKEVFARIGPWDPGLARLEDYDWFLRFALAGGRLQVWNAIVAMLEVEGKPSAQTIEAAARHLLNKYAGPDSPYILPGPMVRRLKALLDVERASICRYRGQWLAALFHLARSFMRVPRGTVHLRRFWINHDVAPEVDPRGDMTTCPPAEREREPSL